MKTGGVADRNKAATSKCVFTGSNLVTGAAISLFGWDYLLKRRNFQRLPIQRVSQNTQTKQKHKNYRTIVPG